MALAALAVTLRLLVPSGFMLAPTDRGGAPQMVICTGQGAMALEVDADGHITKTPLNKAAKDRSGSKDRPDHPCSFAAASAAVTAPLMLAMIAPPALEQAKCGALPRDQRPGLGLAAPPPHTTGPPSIL